MDKFIVRYTTEASEDLERLIRFILNKPDPDIALAERAIKAIESTIKQLSRFPYNCRKVLSNNPYLREVIIPFSNYGYIAIYEIDPDAKTVTILAVRHQREDDYH